MKLSEFIRKLQDLEPRYADFDVDSSDIGLRNGPVEVDVMSHGDEFRTMKHEYGYERERCKLGIWNGPSKGKLGKRRRLPVSIK